MYAEEDSRAVFPKRWRKRWMTHHHHLLNILFSDSDVSSPWNTDVEPNKKKCKSSTIPGATSVAAWRWSSVDDYVMWNVWVWTVTVAVSARQSWFDPFCWLSVSSSCLFKHTHTHTSLEFGAQSHAPLHFRSLDSRLSAAWLQGTSAVRLQIQLAVFHRCGSQKTSIHFSGLFEL